MSQTGLFVFCPGSKTNGNPKELLDLYAQRWEIDMLFSVLKTTGFDLETTYLT